MIFWLGIGFLVCGLFVIGYSAFGLWYDTDAQRRKRALRDAERRANQFRYMQP